MVRLPYQHVALATRSMAVRIYMTVNKHILIIADKCIDKISAYFLAAASNKHMCLLTSLYGISTGRYFC